MQFPFPRSNFCDLWVHSLPHPIPSSERKEKDKAAKDYKETFMCIFTFVLSCQRKISDDLIYIGLTLCTMRNSIWLSSLFTFQCSVMYFTYFGASLVAQMVKRLPAVRETGVRSLGQEDPLEKEMATHSSVLAWRIPGTGGPDGLPSMGSHRVRHNWATSLTLHIFEKKSLIFAK